MTLNRRLQGPPLHTMFFKPKQNTNSTTMFIGSHTTVKPMKRTLALLFCLLMITMPFAGCIGGDIETS